MLNVAENNLPRGPKNASQLFNNADNTNNTNKGVIGRLIVFA